MGFLRKLFRGLAVQPVKENSDGVINVYVIHGTSYQAELLRIVQKNARKYERVLIVSLNKPYQDIMAMLNENNINPKKFLIIDSVTKDLSRNFDGKEAVFTASPKDIESFSRDLIEIIEKEKFNCLIFDSLSTLMIYDHRISYIKFIHDLFIKIRLSNAAGEFTILSGDVDSDLAKDTSMFADRLIDLKQEHEKINYDEKKRDNVMKLEKELKSIEQAYMAKFMSEESYLSTKKRVEKSLSKLRR